ncbi:hypothetical protein HK405_013997, partial [Cladochytrium tenue]
ERARPHLDAIRGAFKVEKVDMEKISNKERFKRKLKEAAQDDLGLLEGFDSGGAAAAAAAAAALSTAVNADTASVISGLAGRIVGAVGSADPVGDFNAMLARRDEDLVGKAIDELSNMVFRLVETPDVQLHGKALACLGALRAGCLAHDEAARYNTFLALHLRPLLLAGAGRRYSAPPADPAAPAGFPEFWKLVKERDAQGDPRCRPISTAEAADSDLPPEEAEKFFSSDEPPATAPLPSVEDTFEDDDEMLGMLD